MLDETKLTSTVLDGEEEKTEEATPSEETKASAALLDGEGDGATDTPSEEGKDGDDSSEPSKEGGEAN